MTEQDILISRIVDREETPDDWNRLKALTVHEERITGDLLAALRDESTLRTAVEEAVAVADKVELVPPRTPGVLRRRPILKNKLTEWGGWMAAAVITLIWMATDPRFKHTPEDGVPVAGADNTEMQQPSTGDPDASPTSARLASDDVVRELPDVMVETRQIPNSDKIEVFFLRRTLERAVLSEAYRFSRDESGQPFRTTVDPNAYAPKRSY